MFEIIIEVTRRSGDGSRGEAVYSLMRAAVAAAIGDVKARKVWLSSAEQNHLPPPMQGLLAKALTSGDHDWNGWAGDVGEALKDYHYAAA